MMCAARSEAIKWEVETDVGRYRVYRAVLEKQIQTVEKFSGEVWT